uniref:Uncharacterized protein n=1 Tax=Oryza meridionalis TaxID=40149 RepID=A0A0E0D0L7_9ORYZ
MSTSGCRRRSLGTSPFVDKRAAEGHNLAIVEDLAARLTIVLAPTPLWSANSYGQKFCAPPPMKVWQFMRNDENLVCLLHRRGFAPVMQSPQPVLAPLAPCSHPPLAKWSDAGGTRVFLPQEPRHTITARSTNVAMGMSGLASVKWPPRPCQERRQCEEEAA